MRMSLRGAVIGKTHIRNKVKLKNTIKLNNSI